MAATKYTKTEFVWQTKIDTYIQCKAYAGDVYKDYADTLLKNAKKTKKHPGFPKDESMKLYRIMRPMIEGIEKTASSTLNLNTVGELQGAGRKDMADMFEKKAKKFAICDPREVDPVDDDKPAAKAKPVRKITSVAAGDKPVAKPPPKRGKAAVIKDPTDLASLAVAKISLKKLIAAVKHSDLLIDKATVESTSGMVVILQGFQDELEEVEVANGNPEVVFEKFRQERDSGRLMRMHEDMAVCICVCVVPKNGNRDPTKGELCSRRYVFR